jgi:hypothetical protein
MKLLEIGPLGLLRLSFFTGIIGYAIIAVTPRGWGLVKVGFLLLGVAGAFFCLYLYKRWPGEWASQSPVRWILCALGYAVLAFFALGTIWVSVVRLFS